MKREILELFIKKYNLSDVITKVKLKYTPSTKTLHARACADNRSFMADVILNDFTGFGDLDAVICIGDTDKVQRMLAPFGNDITLSINQQGDRVLGFSITDADCESYCSAADPISIDAVPKNLDAMPEPEVIVQLTDDLISKFLKSKTALKDVDTFAVGMNKNGLFEIVFGYLTSNSNKIRITPVTDPIKNKVEKSLQFPIKNIAEALKSNADMDNGTLSINSEGIVHISFKNDLFTCNYYQFANKPKN